MNALYLESSNRLSHSSPPHSLNQVSRDDGSSKRDFGQRYITYHATKNAHFGSLYAHVRYVAPATKNAYNVENACRTDRLEFRENKILR